MLSLLMVAGLAGCATTRKPVVQCSFPSQKAPAPGSALVAQDYGAITAIPLDAVQYTDALKRKVVVQMLSAGRTPTNTVQVTARLVNCTNDSLTVGVRTNFMDAREVPTEAQSVWQNVILQPKAMGLYQTSSMSKGVEHYVLELRDAGGH
jgi:uncharacterized lipoprotein YmbA